MYLQVMGNFAKRKESQSEPKNLTYNGRLFNRQNLRTVHTLELIDPKRANYNTKKERG